MAEPLTARSTLEDSTVVANDRGNIDTQEPVSIRKATDEIGKVCWENFAVRVNKPQQRRSFGLAGSIEDEISFFEKYSSENNV